jgi:hypothetical protein
VKWSRSDIRQARQTPLKSVLERLGYRLDPRPGGNYIVAGLANEVVVKDHYWNCPDAGTAGNAIDFLVKIRGAPFNQAMEWLMAGRNDRNGGG